MIKVLPLLLTAFAVSSFADSNISYLSVKNDAVYFSTTNAKQHTVPSCGAGEDANMWAFSLDDNIGRAKYSMLVTAIASKSILTVKPANTCEIIGVEAPSELSFGQEGNLPVGAGYYKSCNEILINNPAAQDGHYTIQPGTPGIITVYCDMEFSGGWTLVMRGKEGDIPSNWSTSTASINVANDNSPSGNTFKFSDDLINYLKTESYRVNHNGLSIFFKPTCAYNHLGKTDYSSGYECAVSYESEEFVNRWPYNDTYIPKSSSNRYYLGLKDVQDNGNESFNIITNHQTYGWIVADRTLRRGTYANGTSWRNGADYEGSFNLWVR
ncbi:fibrinogen-like YCDxxxxGGGW domain-containing protein [Colwellia sp. E150_009]